ncbi:DUF6602 domain-containing protein [Adonisia turfae]|uniref:DUF6602 domain-containing protein n=1 Tax=Adonisia turfae CCMR0081 TaxID=2292702 RepID=A0A6M0RPT9_9CYAN|nr:DUF6602 domain-containing protein [Adonisia turfae]NEZ57711.1 hypothetical protein [Adonisia turfae CCMR0081]
MSPNADTDDISLAATTRWFAKTTQEIQDDYIRLHAAARRDPQKAGHEAEAAWKSILELWLPPHYEVGTRKYILPDTNVEGGDDRKCFETDIVVFNPTYPKPLRKKSEVLPGGILAAFFVRLTVDADGIRDASRRAAILKRSTTVRLNTPRLHLQGPFSVGLLAHSHDWKADGSTPFENAKANLERFNRKFALTPREVLDFTCIADLALWTTSHWIKLPQTVAVSTSSAGPSANTSPVARLMMQLIYRLSYVDPTLRHWALGLLAALPVGVNSQVDWRHWDITDGLPSRVIEDIQKRGFDNIGGGQNDWQSVFA